MKEHKIELRDKRICWSNDQIGASFALTSEPVIIAGACLVYNPDLANQRSEYDRWKSNQSKP